MGANDLSLTRVNFKTNFRKMNVRSTLDSTHTFGCTFQLFGNPGRRKVRQIRKLQISFALSGTLNRCDVPKTACELHRTHQIHLQRNGVRWWNPISQWDNLGHSSYNRHKRQQTCLLQSLLQPRITIGFRNWNTCNHCIGF